MLIVGAALLSLPPRAVFACDLPVSTARGAQFYPEMVPDGAGGAFVVWRDTRNSGNGDDLYVQRLSPGLIVAPGWPTDGIAVAAAVETQWLQQVIPDGAGGVIIAWEDLRNGPVTLHDIYAQRFNGDGTIAAGWPVNGLPLCTAPDAQMRPALASDGAGGAIVVWEDYRAGAYPNGDIYATRVTANGTLAPGWTPNGNPLATTPDAQGDPVVVEDGAGGTIVAWGDAGAPRSVRAVRLTGDGAVAPGWPAAGVALATGERPMGGGKQIVSDGAGGAIVAWQDLRNDPFDITNHDLYAQRVLPDGSLAPGWPANGAAICEAIDLQHEMDMLADGSGGAVIVWEDYRSEGADVYGQRVTANGSLAPGWIADGNPLAVGLGFQLNPRATLDGLGGVMLAFDQLPPGGPTYDLYAQRILLDGSFPSGWSLAPRPLCLGSAEDYNSAVASDGAGGLIVAANHVLGNINDLYAIWVPSVPVPTLVSLVSAEATAHRVVLMWHGAESAGSSGRVERRSEAADWEQRATLRADGEGTFRYEDRSVRPGERYGYRLAYWSESAGEVTTTEEWVTVPALRFALAGAQPNPVVDELVVGFSLPQAGPARIEVFDLAGRQLLARDVGSHGIGSHRVTLAGRGALPAGVYHLALTQGAQRAVARAVVTR